MLLDVPWRRGQAPAYGETYEQIREDLLAVLVDGMPCPICSSPMFRRHMPVVNHAGAAGR